MRRVAAFILAMALVAPVATVRGTDGAALKPGSAEARAAATRAGSRASQGGAATPRPRPATATPRGASATPRPAATAPAEWRGVWVSRFEWTPGTPEEIRGRIARMMRSLAAGNFNAVIFQVRGQADTLYPSRLEPWSAMIPAEMRRSDPVAYALGQAKRNGLQFHAWLNLMVIWQDKGRGFPSDRSHPFYEWANPSDESRARGVIRDEKRRPEFFGEADYTWFTPGNPDVEVYLRRVVMDFIARYQVDGLHWDDRTAVPNGASFDPVSLARFQGRGNPMRIRGMYAWQRDQMTRILTNIYVSVTAKRPELLVSAAPFGIYDKERIAGYDKYKDCIRDFGSDGEHWMEKGVIDVLMPQVYWKEGPPGPSYSTVVRDWLDNNRSGRPIWPGSALGDFGGKQPLKTSQVEYVRLSRSLGTGGNTFWSYTEASDAEWAAAKEFLYPAKARVPVPVHKARPTTGQVMGTVTSPTGAPQMDAWIRIDGREYIYTSSSDGFFGVPSVPPGTRVLEVQFTDGTTMRRSVQVTAGRTSVANFRQEGRVKRPAGVASRQKR